MSTEINISVGYETLIDQLRLQQNVNRQTLLERENEKDVQVKAIDARTKQLASQGKDANNDSLYGTRTKQPQIDRRPAANNLPSYYVAEGLLWGLDFKSGGGPVDLILTRLNPADFSVKNTYVFTVASIPTYPTTDDILSTGSLFINQGTTVVTTVPENPGPGENFEVTTVESNAASSPPTTVSAVVLRLPIKKDAYILVSMGKGVYFRATISRTTVYTEIYNPEGIDQPDEYLAINSTSGFNVSTYEWIKCFYIDDNTCREISAPPNIFTNFSAYLRDFEFNATTTYNPTIYQISKINGVVTSGTLDSIFSINITDANQFIAFPDFRDKYRLYSFMATNDSNNSITTPGIYKALQLNPTDARFDGNASNTTLTNVDYVVNQFYGGFQNLPKFGLQTIYDPSPNYEKQYRHDRTKNRPIYNRNLVGDETGSLIKNDNVRTLLSEGLVWDWNNPSYCRQELLALGFTSSDLEP